MHKYRKLYEANYPMVRARRAMYWYDLGYLVGEWHKRHSAKQFQASWLDYGQKTTPPPVLNARWKVPAVDNKLLGAEYLEECQATKNQIMHSMRLDPSHFR